MRKGILIMSLACTLTLVLSACGGGTNVSEKVTNNDKVKQSVPKTENTKTVDTKTTNAAVHSFKVADDFWVTYNGKKYSFPTDTSMIKDWKADEVTGELKPNQYGLSVSYNKEGYVPISATPVNDSTTSKKLADCKIAGISVYKFSRLKTMEVALPNGIKIGSSYSDVIKAYGKPTVDKVNKDDATLKSVQYNLESMIYVRIDVTNNVISGFKIMYMPN
ncbi:hypothetical protein [Clostridium sp.]|uniref:hypothetical protein n=1 Tax=Clostridium sp. TaxID=1506 RepID=UPI002609371D|nr:hypothetical protein [uncultured Clostridium sp.]